MIHGVEKCQARLLIKNAGNVRSAGQSRSRETNRLDDNARRRWTSLVFLRFVTENQLFPSQYQLRIMEACQMSSPAPVGPEAPPAEGQHIDLTEDLAKQLEDIISTYQAENPAEPEDAEEVTAVKEADTRKDQKLEKKMLKNLGVLLFFSLSQNVLLILAEVGFHSARSAEVRVVLKPIGV